MADKPTNVNMNTLRTALAGRGGLATVGMSAEATPVALPSGEVLNVEGLKVAAVFNETAGAVAVLVKHTTDGTAVALHDSAGVVTLAAGSAQVLDISGIAFIEFDDAVTVVLAS
jgi:hypothetical protein